MNTRLFQIAAASLILIALAYSQGLKGKAQPFVRVAANTNNIIILSTNTPGMAEFISNEDLARQLITNGTVCQVAGHQWGPYKGFLAIPAINPPPPMPVLRTCALCKRIEQQVSVWNEVTVDQIGNITSK